MQYHYPHSLRLQHLYRRRLSRDAQATPLFGHTLAVFKPVAVGNDRVGIQPWALSAELRDPQLQWQAGNDYLVGKLVWHKMYPG